jgi:hypothetical protein
MTHGGRRRGAGRKEGTANTRTREIADRAAAHGITPLEYMLDLMRKPYPKDADAKTLADYDAMKLDAAKGAAPYIHPRLANVDKAVSIGLLSGDLAAQGRTVLKALSSGDITPSQANTIMQALAAQARIVETDELERRVSELERSRGEDGKTQRQPGQA